MVAVRASQVPHSETLALGAPVTFSVAAWVNTNRITTDVPGDILSKFCGDHAARLQLRHSDRCRRGLLPKQLAQRLLWNR